MSQHCVQELISIKMVKFQKEEKEGQIGFTPWGRCGPVVSGTIAGLWIEFSNTSKGNDTNLTSTSWSLEHYICNLVRLFAESQC